MTKAWKRTVGGVAQGSLPSKIGKKKVLNIKSNATKSGIDIFNEFQLLFNSDNDDDVPLPAMLPTSDASFSVGTRRPPPNLIFYCDYTKTKKVILNSVSVNRDTTFKVLTNNLVIWTVDIVHHTRITGYIKINKIEYFI